MSASPVEPFHVVFVCTGNICRSPMADVVFRWFADAAGVGDRVASTSAGTGDWHVGERADQRTFDHGARSLDVPDPYYAGPALFDEVLVMIESGSRSLFRQLEPAIRPASR
jgi:protein-tyrosine-phosphatase